MLRTTRFALMAVLSLSALQPQEQLQPADLKVRDSDTLNPPAKVGPAQVREDIGLLTYALEHAYGGRRFVPEPDFAEAVRLLAALAADPPSDPDLLCDQIGDALWRIPDNHLTAVSGSRFCGRQSGRRRPEVGKNVASHLGQGIPWSLTGLKVAGKTVPVLSITHFPAPQNPVWNGFSEALATLAESEAVVIDLRGNWGGNDERGQELAEVLLGRPPGAYFDAIIKRQTPGAFVILSNPLRISQIQLLREGKQLPAYDLEWYQELGELYSEALAGRLPEEQTDDFPSPSDDSWPEAFRHPVVVLADAGCASSCEDTLLYLHRHRQAVTIGEPTGGYLHFGDIGCLILPNSQLRVNIPTKHYQIRGAYYERIGIEPDIRVPPGSDALDAAKAWLADHFARTEGRK